MVKEIKKYIKKQGGLFTKGSFDYLFFAFLLAIIVVGLLVLYSASYPWAYYEQQDSTYYFIPQLQGVIAGFLIMIFVSKINFKVFYHIGAYAGTAIACGLLLLTLFKNGDGDIRRWLSIGPIRFQPSDIAKFALILTLAYILDKRFSQTVSKRPLEGSFPSAVNSYAGKPLLNESLIPIFMAGGITVLYTLLVVLGSHLSGAVLMMASGIILMYLGGIRAKWFAVGFPSVAAFGIIAYKSGILKDYMNARVDAWLYPDTVSPDIRYQTNQGLYAIGSGGFAGRGLGQSTQKYLYVPETHNDMIFTIAVEELGFIGAVVIILLFALLIWRGVVVGINSPSRYGALVAMGITFQLAVQVCLNIAVATDSVPNTGILLPFFSYGRTAMIVNMTEMGLVLSISRTSRIKRR